MNRVQSWIGGALPVLVASVVFATTAFADSLFTQKVAEQGTLVSLKKKKFEPGDIITVMVREKIQASTNSNTNTKKESDVESEANENDNEFLVAEKPDGLGILDPEKLPNWAIGTKNEQRTTGQTQRQNQLVTTITCTVKEMYPNGTLLIEGEKVVSVNREDSRIYVRGIARARDVSPNNVIDSTQLADATIELKGRGPLWNNQRRGLLTRFLDWVAPY
ncbi:MAG: flagellar basal body L-ring protein FlgH [Candidatus Hydrogenedentes bacterium]|nr:flagellar basal body L-ring protein FlgH [Candidatus Hydrogenedentota bacterium]